MSTRIYDEVKVAELAQALRRARTMTIEVAWRDADHRCDALAAADLILDAQNAVQRRDFDAVERAINAAIWFGVFPPEVEIELGELVEAARECQHDLGDEDGWVVCRACDAVFGVAGYQCDEEAEFNAWTGERID